MFALRASRMGRQVGISVLPEDVEGLLAQIKSKDRVTLVTRTEVRLANVTPLEVPPADASKQLILWNQKLLPQLQRKHIGGDYYSVDDLTEPVLEFSNSILVEWCGRPSLVQGRIYGIFDGKSREFVRWYEKIVRGIRKTFVRSPAPLFGYVGPAAYKWFLEGGLLLPGYRPPEVDLWRKFFADQDLIRVRLNSDAERKFSTPD
jgi:hypothetical protein